MHDVLYQKVGLTVNRLAQDLMSREPGERIPSISEYMDRFQVSRGTVQNSLGYLKEKQAVHLVSRGHLGTFLERLDLQRLQECSSSTELLGSMPLPYSKTYQGLATALYDALAPFSANLVYARGAEGRMRLVTSGVCHFTACSKYAAKKAMENGCAIRIAVDLGPGSFLSRHVLVLRDPEAGGIRPGMRVAFDWASIDQREITREITQGVEGIQFVELKSHQTVAAIRSGIIDAGVWNLDEIRDSEYKDLPYVELDHFANHADFSSAALVVGRDEDAMCRLLERYVDPKRIVEIQNGVREGSLAADY